MTFAAVTYVNLEGRDPADGLRLLNETIVPRTKAMPGFVSARFLRSQDGKTGIGSVICDSQAHAQECLNSMGDERPSEGPPVTSAEIYEVVLEV
ncbi:MAG: hypothetical protein J2P29_09055 [Actinobacteria bacterium]|nr:hypothetical protein [Actinomycetota bacterium]